MRFFEGILLLSFASACLAKLESSPDQDEIEIGAENSRNQKVLGLFNVIKFPNTECYGSGTNGTCYTSSECSAKGWKSDGTCASGYGVCCIAKPGCGGQSSENITYLDSASAKLSSYPGACTYSICPKSADICRIRFDFESFTIGGPLVTTDTTQAGGAVGDCGGDRFSITSTSGKGSPVICGTNTGQHMVLDVSSGCLQANFYLTSSSVASYNIKVTQYQCGSEMGGPTGCLQYFTSESGSFSSFNYKSNTNLLTNPHLSNQCYDICIRRASGKCYICYEVSSLPMVMEYFGLSAGAIGTDDASNVDSQCVSDYIVIPGGTTDALVSTSGYITPLVNRNCGRLLATDVAPANEPVCTRLAPFRVSFKTDADEVTTGTDVTTNELLGGPTFGTTGFKLSFTQYTC